MTPRERVLAVLAGENPDEKPLMIWPQEEMYSDITIVPAGRVNNHGSKARILLVEVLSPFSRAISRHINLNEILQEDPAKGEEILRGLVQETKSEIEAARNLGADGVFYRLQGAEPAYSTPMEYGGHYLEVDREILTPNAEHPTPNAQDLTPNTQHPTPNPQYPTPNTQHSTPNTQHATPNTQHPTPNTQYLTPNTQHSTPNTQHPTPNTQHSTPNTQHPTPNAQSLNVLFVEGGPETYIDFVSDLPAAIFAWDCERTGIPVSAVRRLRKGALATSDREADILFGESFEACLIGSISNERQPGAIAKTTPPPPAGEVGELANREGGIKQLAPEGPFLRKGGEVAASNV